MHETLASKVILVLFGPPCALAATGCGREHGFASCRLWTPIAVYISVSQGYEHLALSPNAKLDPRLEASNPKSYALYPEPKVPTPAAPEELKN